MRVRHGFATIALTATLTIAMGVTASADDAPSTQDSAGGSTTDTLPTASPSAPDDPPATATDAPSTEPPSTEPPSTEPPSTEPPSTDPPSTEYVTAQDIEVESVQVAVSSTGDNQSVPAPTAPSSAGAAAGTGLTTGTATAVGSSDDTGVVQQVVADTDDTSQVDIVQVSIVFNIGGAFANSGNNALASAPQGSGTGTIGTGGATAVGNDAATFITQGAGAVAHAGDVATTDQRTATLRIGIAMANSGGNAIATGSGSGPATASSGAATAIGNLSSTAITQLVGASARGGADIAVVQRATVINFGLAFADSGSNRIGTELAAAISTSDQGALERLLASIVPALVSSLERSPATGEISTGDARAIGNRSTTEVLQVVAADARAGSVRISQDVVVVNAGAATATTGTNRIGAAVESSNTATGSNALAVAAELASFLRTLLADIEAWSSGTSAGSGPDSLTTQLGDFAIGIDRTLTAQSTGAGSSIVTRQLAAVVNLAIARANSGGNQVTTGNSDTERAAASADVAGSPVGDAGSEPALVVVAGDRVVIITGDASARNSAVLVLCQRANMRDLRCLAPPSSTPAVDDRAPGDPATDVDRRVDAEPTPRAAVMAPTMRQAPAPVQGARSLPATGTDTSALLIAAFAITLMGAAMVGLTRRTT